MSRWWRRALAVVALVGGAASASAQDSLGYLPPTPATVVGRVIIPGPAGDTPVPGVMVTIHRVGPDSAAPLDSARTGADGRYSMRYTRFGSTEAVYFSAAVYRGIAYFSTPLRSVRTVGDDGAITVFETTTATVPYTIQGRHIVVSAPDGNGDRKIVEVYEVSNDSNVTAVGRDTLTSVWSAPIPAAATEFVGGEGDVAAGSLARRENRVHLLAPFGPGVKQLSFSYTLASRAFPLEQSLERATVVFEVLLEEQAAQVRGKSLRSEGDAATQGRTFKRFLGQGVPQGEQYRIEVPAVALATRTQVLIGLAIFIGLAMAAALARALMRRAPRGSPAAAPPLETERLTALLASLDARREAGDTSLTDDAYRAERGAIKARLTAALAARSPAE